MAEAVLRIGWLKSPVAVLGPGLRAGIWVQGCRLGCRGCLVPESWPVEGGYSLTVDHLAAWVLDQTGITGVTLSGGEPMDQAAVLVAVLDRVRQARDLDVLCYTGFTLDQLRQRGTDSQRALLERVDLLIDGPYRAGRHADLLWRGSDNQRLLALSPRGHRLLADAGLGPDPGPDPGPERFPSAGDYSAGLELTVDMEGRIDMVGVPQTAGFRQRLADGLRRRGLVLAGPEDVGGDAGAEAGAEAGLPAGKEEP